MTRRVFISGVATRLMPNAGVAPREALKALLKERAPRRLDRLSELCVLVAGEALQDAGLSLQPLTGAVSERAGVFFATGHGNLTGTFQFLASLQQKGQRFASPIEFPNLVLSAPTGTVSIQFGFRGELVAHNEGELCGAQALVAAYDAIAGGRLDLALCVGADELGAGRQVCAARPGRILGEGAGAIVLQSAPSGVEVAGTALCGGPEALEEAIKAASQGRAYELAEDPAMQQGFLESHSLLDAAFAVRRLRSGEARACMVAAAEPNNAAAMFLRSVSA